MKLLLFKTYLQTIKNSVDSNIFRNLFAEVDGEKQDILKDGKISCGVHTSSILFLFDLIEEKHATVLGTIRDMENFGWQKIEKPKPGSVIHWEEWNQGDSPSEHIGFYIGDEIAVSNNWQSKTPQEHHWTYNDSRGIEGIYWHPKLEDL